MRIILKDQSAILRLPVSQTIYFLITNLIWNINWWKLLKSILMFNLVFLFPLYINFANKSNDHSYNQTYTSIYHYAKRIIIKYHKMKTQQRLSTM